MDMAAKILEPDEALLSKQQDNRKLTALERNNLKWESHRPEIRIIYLDQDETLKDTMAWFKRERSFKGRLVIQSLRGCLTDTIP